MIAITGAAGFIGSNLAHRLAGLDYELLLVDHPLTAAKSKNFVGLKAFEFLEHGIFLEYLEQEAPPIDAVFHLGACSRTTETSWDYLLANNVEYSQTLWNWCARQGCPFIYASSAATYGDGSMGFDDRIVPEELHPLNLYGKSKNDFDRWVLEQIQRDEASPPIWAGMKFFNVYGPREIHKERMASVIWSAYQQILATGEVKLFKSNDPEIADGEQKRDFVFVDDCVDHMIWLWQHGMASGIFNSGTGTARTFVDLVKATFSALGKEPKIKFIEMPGDLSRQYQNFTEADMSKLRSAGYDKHPTSLEEGVRKYVEFLTANQK
jgi:ADP-L-glycero-D-manno-heptose 6-epimerase